MRTDGLGMNTIILSKWQVEILKEAFAMLARQEADRLNRPSTAELARKDKLRAEQNLEISFAV